MITLPLEQAATALYDLSRAPMVRGYQPVFPQDHCTASLKWLGSFEPSHLGIAGVNYRTT